MGILRRLSGVGKQKDQGGATVAASRGRRRVMAPLPFLAGLDTTLLHLSAKDRWTLRDAFAGVHVFGGNGSGKTSGSGKSLAKAYLKAGFGGLVLIAKPDERATWLNYAAECGRSDEVIIVDDEAKWRFNFMHYEMTRPAYGARKGFGGHIKRVENLISTLMNVLEQSGRDLGGGDNQIWIQSAEILLRNVLLVIAGTKPDFTIADINSFIDAAPKSDKVVRGPEFAGSAFAAELRKAEENFKAAGRGNDFDVIKRYWLVQYPQLVEKTRSSILFTLTAMMQDLQTGTLSDLFGTGTNYFPEDSHHGAIILLDLPAVISRSNVMAQILFKTIWQQAALRRMEDITNDTRPVFLWADEAHFFVSKGDTDFQSLARGARVATVFLTQNLNAYYQRMGGSAAEATADALLGYFQTMIFHGQSDPKTVRLAQSLFGKREVFKQGLQEGSTENRNIGKNSGGGIDEKGTAQKSGNSDSIGDGSSTGYSLTQQTDDAIRPEQFNELATGGPDHNFKVGAFIWRAGKVWKHTNSVVLTSEFNQKI